MAFLTSAACVALIGFVSKTVAHGLVTGIIAEGEYHQGYGPGFAWTQNPPAVAAWSTPEDKDTGYVNDYTSPDIICHKGATPGQLYVTVAAGDQVTFEWTNWPESHHGPIMDYLANCNGECTDVKKEDLLFNKIDESGLISWDASPGKWASDNLIANNNSWTVTIPASIAPGKYVLRHEIIALHSANNINGAQNYPQCVNLEITGSGSDGLPTGTKGTELYTANDPGIFINIYWPKVTSYVIPGPKLVDAATAPASPSDSVSTPSITTTPSGTRPTYPPYGNDTITTHITETLTTFETVTIYPSSTVSSDSSQSSNPESSNDSSRSPSSIPANVNIPSNPNTPPATPTNQPWMDVPASSTVAAVEGSPSPQVTGKPKKFVCYEETD